MQSRPEGSQRTLARPRLRMIISHKGGPMFTRHGRRTMLAAGALAMVVGLAGCAAKVKQEDFNSEVAKIRQEMQAGDQAMNATGTSRAVKSRPVLFALGVPSGAVARSGDGG